MNGAIGRSLVSLLFGASIKGLRTKNLRSSRTRFPEPAFGRCSLSFFQQLPESRQGIFSAVTSKTVQFHSLRTIVAIRTGYIIYMGIPLILDAHASPEPLIQNPPVMRRIALGGDAILLGVWGATLSGVLGSILGAPRVLQALARDGVLPRAFRFLGQGNGPDDEPRIGTAITFPIAMVTVMLGNLNMVTPILTMFFLTTYGVLNISAGLERFLGNPSNRHTFRVPGTVSLLGAVGRAGVMFLINLLSTWIAVGL